MSNELGLPYVVVALLYMALQMLISLGLIWLPVNHYLYAGVVLVLLGAGYLLFMKNYHHLHKEYLKSLEK